MKRFVSFASIAGLAGLGTLVPAHADVAKECLSQEHEVHCPSSEHEAHQVHCPSSEYDAEEYRAYDDEEYPAEEYYDEECFAPPLSHAATPFVMPDLVATSTWGVQVGWMRVNNFDNDLDVFTSEVYGQVELSPSLFVFGRVPVAHIRQVGGPEQARETDLGNITGGLRYVAKLDSLRLGVSGAVSLATSPRYEFADVDAEDVEQGDVDVSAEQDGAAAFLATLARYDTLGDYLPSTRGLYARGDLRYDLTRGFIQAQIGYEQYMPSGREDRFDLMRGGLALGLQATERLSLIGEATALSYEQWGGDLFRRPGDEVQYWLNVGARYDRDGSNLGARLYLPMDSPLGPSRDEVGVIVDLRGRL